MKKRFLDTEVWKYIRTLIEILLLAALITGVIYAVNAFLNQCAKAEEWDEHEEEYEIAYAICTKGDIVHIRPFPNTKHESCGWLDPGDIVYLDGKKKNGFLHCVGLNVESGEGWVHKGYLVKDEPIYVNKKATIVSKGKLRARKYVNGKRTRWLKPNATLIVYYWSDEWCSTNCGYVQSKYLQLGE